MKTDVENLSSTRIKIVVEIPFDELGEDIKTAYRTIASQVNIPGFRKGKVPARIIDQRFGRGSVLSEVANAVIPRTYDAVVAERNLIPLGQPDVEVTKIEDGDVFEFVAEVDIRPEFDLPPIEGLAVEVDAVEVTDEAVAEELLNLRKRFSSFNEVDRPAAVGDVVLLDVTATDEEGEPSDAYSAESLSYEIGTDGAIDGLAEAVTGAAGGEQRTFDHTPADGPFEGSTFTLEVTVKAVRERELPEADDQFAQDASEFDTVAELEADLRARLRRAGLFRLGTEARQKVREAYLALAQVDLPERVIADQLDEHFADGHGDGGHRAEHEAELRDNLKASFVLDKLAEEQDIRVEESELTQWLISQASQYGMTPDQFANALVSGGQVQMAIAEVRRAKALNLIVAGATITDTDGGPVDLDAISRELTGGQSIEQLIESLDIEPETGDDADADAEADDDTDAPTDETVATPTDA